MTFDQFAKNCPLHRVTESRGMYTEKGILNKCKLLGVSCDESICIGWYVHTLQDTDTTWEK